MTRSNSVLARASGSDGEWRTTMPIAAHGDDAGRVQRLVAAFMNKRPIEGKVIGWNKGGFHVSLDR